jgi:hypothetical protein
MSEVSEKEFMAFCKKKGKVIEDKIFLFLKQKDDEIKR